MHSNIKVPSEVAKITQKTMYLTDASGKYIFPLNNDGLFILLACQEYQKQFDIAKRDPKKLVEFQKNTLKQIEKLKRNQVIPINSKKIREDILDE